MNQTEKEKTAALMQGIAKGVDSIVHPNGFVVLVIASKGVEGSQTNYVSNLDKRDIIVAMKEIIARFEGQAQQSGRA